MEAELVVNDNWDGMWPYDRFTFDRLLSRPYPLGGFPKAICPHCEVFLLLEMPKEFAELDDGSTSWKCPKCDGAIRQNSDLVMFTG